MVFGLNYSPPRTWMKECRKFISAQFSITICISTLEASLVSYKDILIFELPMVVVDFLWV